MPKSAPSLHPRLAEADDELRGKALAKACRALSRMRSADALRGHTREAADGEPEDGGELLLRRIIVQQAWNDDFEAVGQLAAALLEGESGPRYLIRALNNLRSLQTRAASGLSLILLEALRPACDAAAFAKSLARALAAVRRETSFTGRLLELAALHVRAAWADPGDIRTWLVQELVAADLRLDADSDAIIRKRGPLRPIRLRGATRARLEKVAEDDGAHWSARLAALWLLGAADPAGHERAMVAIERAFNEFPLESLAAVDQVQIAFEYEATERVDEIRLSESISEVRHAGLAELESADGSALAALMTPLVDGAASGNFAPAAILESGDAPILERLAAAAFVDRRTRLDVVERLASTGELETVAHALFSRQDHASAGLVDLSASVIGTLASGDADRFSNSLLVWEQSVARDDATLVEAAARQIVSALGH